jgi:hypothetical protein
VQFPSGIQTINLVSLLAKAAVCACFLAALRARPLVALRVAVVCALAADTTTM